MGGGCLRGSRLQCFIVLLAGTRHSRSRESIIINVRHLLSLIIDAYVMLLIRALKWVGAETLAMMMW